MFIQGFRDTRVCSECLRDDGLWAATGALTRLVHIYLGLQRADIERTHARRVGRCFLL